METTAWADLSDEALLDKKISQLGLTLAGTPLQPLVQQLYDELSAKGLAFHPPCHIGDEWFVPVGIPAIFVPFFLTHERLRKLERAMMLEVEGENPEWFMRLMRHEAAHAYAYAYQLTRKKKWQRVFGKTSADDTPDFYRPRPYSHSYVVHLDDWYAQSHPDEDFAETFAVWLTPGLDWRTRFKGWKALQKLEYVDELMRSLAGVMAPHQPGYRVKDFNFLNVKLKTYYARKKKLYEDTYPDFYDRDLRQLFTGASDVGAAPRGEGAPAPAAPRGDPAGAGPAPGPKASQYLRSRRRELLDAVCEPTNEKRYRVNKLLARLIERCDQLGLRLPPTGPTPDLAVGAYITTLVMNYLFTGKFKRTK
jgi:hypothetical protein